MYVTDRFDVCVDYAKKRCFSVSDRDVFQNVAVDVNRMYTSSYIRRKFRQSRMTLRTTTPTSIIPTRFEVDMTIHCRVIAFLYADTSHDLVTLTFDLFTLNSYHTWRVTCPNLPPCLKTLWLLFMSYELWRFPLITIDNAYAATVHVPNYMTREQGVKNNYIFWNPRPRFGYSLYNFVWAKFDWHH